MYGKWSEPGGKKMFSRFHSRCFSFPKTTKYSSLPDRNIVFSLQDFTFSFSEVFCSKPTILLLISAGNSLESLTLDNIISYKVYCFLCWWRNLWFSRNYEVYKSADSKYPQKSKWFNLFKKFIRTTRRDIYSLFSVRPHHHRR